MASNVKFEIIQHLCVLSDKGNGWRKECNLVRWNDGVPKFDVREWAPDRSSMSKGMTFTRKEFAVLQSNIRYVKVSQWDRMLRDMEKTEESSSKPQENTAIQGEPVIQENSVTPFDFAVVSNVENTPASAPEGTPENSADIAPEEPMMVPTLPIDSNAETLPEEKMASGM